MTLADIRDRILSRCECDPSDTQAQAAATSATNEGQRLFVFLTLSLEVTSVFTLSSGVGLYHMLGTFPDWLVPLRVRLQATSAKPILRPATMYQMAAINPAWMNTTGTATRYGSLGWDLLFLDAKPTSTPNLLITYARSCVDLVNDSDVPEIHDADHETLTDYGTWRMRANEGGQELQASNPMLKSFLDNARMRADQVRARSLAAGYDHLPPQLAGWDYSRLLGRKDLEPNRKESRWTGQP